MGNLDSDYFERFTIDCRPEVVLGAVNLDFRLIDGNLLPSPTVRLEKLLQPMKPLSDRLTRAVDKRFDSPV